MREILFPDISFVICLPSIILPDLSIVFLPTNSPFIMERGDIKIEKYDSEITRNFTEAFLSNLDKLWIKLSLTKKQLLQNKIFPNGLTCQNQIIRTDTLSPSFEYIQSLKQQNSPLVTPRGIEPRLAG